MDYYYLTGVVSFGPSANGMQDWPEKYTRIDLLVGFCEKCAHRTVIDIILELSSIQFAYAIHLVVCAKSLLLIYLNTGQCAQKSDTMTRMSGFSTGQYYLKTVISRGFYVFEWISKSSCRLRLCLCITNCASWRLINVRLHTYAHSTVAMRVYLYMRPHIKILINYLCKLWER